MLPSSSASPDPAPLALYIHWPFCLAKCPYCDFNSHVRDSIPQQRFANALRRELAHEAARINRSVPGGKRHLGSIFFGGGTPSLMSPETVSGLIEDACTLFVPGETVEITLEANPTSVEAPKFRAFRQAGINRLSLGVQSLDDEALKSLGRQHSGRQAIDALELGRSLFPRLSFDLIYARPGQSPESWQKELGQALALASDHLSLYQLTIEPGTQFETLYRRGQLLLPDETLSTRLYHMTNEAAAIHGLEAYEVSNYARPSHESRHNLTYWRYGDYLGIGPGAHSRLRLAAPEADERQILAMRRHYGPEAWAERVEHCGTGVTEETSLSAIECGREALLMGLRLREGISASRFLERTTRKIEDCVVPDILNACIEEGYLIYESGILRATSRGRLLLESLLPRLLL